MPWSAATPRRCSACPAPIGPVTIPLSGAVTGPLRPPTRTLEQQRLHRARGRSPRPPARCGGGQHRRHRRAAARPRAGPPPACPLPPRSTSRRRSPPERMPATQNDGDRRQPTKEDQEHMSRLVKTMGKHPPEEIRRARSASKVLVACVATAGLILALATAAYATLPAGTKVTGNAQVGHQNDLQGRHRLGSDHGHVHQLLRPSATVPSSPSDTVNLNAPPTISGCTDSSGGTDTITTSGTWSLSETSKTHDLGASRRLEPRSSRACSPVARSRPPRRRRTR